MGKFSKKGKNFVKSKLNFNQLLKKLEILCLKPKSIKSICSIYKNYENFFFKNSRYKTHFNQTFSNYIFPSKFFSIATINKFISSLKKNSASTKKKKKNILKKIIFELNSGLIKTKKNKAINNECTFFKNINSEEFIFFANKIFESKNMNLIIVYQLAFELGLGLSQIIKLKCEHIKNNFKYILFKYNGVQIYRVLSFYSSTLLQYHCLSNNISKGKYIIFNEIKNSKNKNRIDICNEKIKNSIKKNIGSKPDLVNKIIKLLNKERPRFKINSIQLNYKTDLYSEIWEILNEEEKKTKQQNKAYEKNKESNKFETSKIMNEINFNDDFNFNINNNFEFNEDIFVNKIFSNDKKDFISENESMFSIFNGL